MVELVTAQGWKFNSCACVNIGGTYYDLDEMTPEQKRNVMGALNVQGLNAAYAGKAVFTAKGIPSVAEIARDLEQSGTAKCEGF